MPKIIFKKSLVEGPIAIQENAEIVKIAKQNGETQMWYSIPESEKTGNLVAKYVHKYPLRIKDKISIEVSGKSEPIHLSVEDGKPYIWFISNNPMGGTSLITEYNFSIGSTGFSKFDETDFYFDSFSLGHEEDLIFHVFLKPSLL